MRLLILLLALFFFVSGHPWFGLLFLVLALPSRLR
jgi:hypothetical protein